MISTLPARSDTLLKRYHAKLNASWIFLSSLTVCICFLSSEIQAANRFEHLYYGNADLDLGIKVCPDDSRHDFCDIRRDIIWRLKRNKYLWGYRCRDNLYGMNDSICGAVLKGSYETCNNGEVPQMAAHCNTDCRNLHLDINGSCTVGNKKRDRCICFANKQEEIVVKKPPKKKKRPKVKPAGGYDTVNAETTYGDGFSNTTEIEGLEGSLNNGTLEVDELDTYETTLTIQEMETSEDPKEAEQAKS